MKKLWLAMKKVWLVVSIGLSAALAVSLHAEAFIPHL
jgi:hypothetical protein